MSSDSDIVSSRGQNGAYSRARSSGLLTQSGSPTHMWHNAISHSTARHAIAIRIRRAVCANGRRGRGLIRDVAWLNPILVPQGVTTYR